MLEGNPATALKDVHSAVLSEEVAEKYFGKQKALGKILEIKVQDSFRTFVVTGITKKSPQNSSIKIKILIPLSFSRTINFDDRWFNFYLNTFFVLKPKANPKTAKAKIAKVFEIDSKVPAKRGAG